VEYTIRDIAKEKALQNTAVSIWPNVTGVWGMELPNHAEDWNPYAVPGKKF
jgi:hypothetical protein